MDKMKQEGTKSKTNTTAWSFHFEHYPGVALMGTKKIISQNIGQGFRANYQFVGCQYLWC